jgi:lysyl-tRNA synthetase class 2
MNSLEKLIEPTLIQPTFVTHLPKELVPLAKLTPDAADHRRRFRVPTGQPEISQTRSVWLDAKQIPS